MFFVFFFVKPTQFYSPDSYTKSKQVQATLVKVALRGRAACTFDLTKARLKIMEKKVILNGHLICLQS